MPQNKIPISVIVVTKNEEHHIRRCLKALIDFDDIWLVDSFSTDKTVEYARQFGVKIQNFKWSGHYPKKRQWCLDTINLKYDRVFFVDADEVVTAELTEELRSLDWKAEGYFVKGQYVFNGKTLRYGLRNNKLALLDRRYMMFPVVDDLNIPGMGEIEGHYQPIFKPGNKLFAVGRIKSPLLHYAYECQGAWKKRHQHYARWEVEMDRRGAWPEDPHFLRQVYKTIFKHLPFRPWFAFFHCYIFKLGFLDGVNGARFALTRAFYYRMISNAGKVEGKKF